MILRNSLLHDRTSERLSILRVLDVDRDHDACWVFDCTKKRTHPAPARVSDLQAALDRGDLELMTTDPYQTLIGEQDIPENRRAERDRRFSVIEPLKDVWDPGLRASVIKEAANGPRASMASQYRWLEAFWRGGQVKNALVPGWDKRGGAGKRRVAVAGQPKRGRPGGTQVNTTAEIEVLFERGIRLFAGKRVSIKQVYLKTMGRFFASDWRIGPDGTPYPIPKAKGDTPTYDQFHYYYTQRGKVAAQDRRRESGQRPATFVARDSLLRPGSVYQIDAFYTDIYLVSSVDRSKVIDKPATVHVVTDVVTGLIPGLSITTGAPKWVGAMRALINAFTPKVEFCALLGVPIQPEEWPALGLPAAITGDRGEMESYASDNLANNLNILTNNTVAYRPWTKSFIERTIGTIKQQLIRPLPGAKDPDRKPHQRTEKPNATLTERELLALLVAYVVKHNNGDPIHKYSLTPEMRADHVIPIPAVLWEWEIENGGSDLRPAPDPERLRLMLLPREEKVTEARGAIRFPGGILYRPSRPIQANWYTDPDKGRLTVAYDPGLVDDVHMCIPGGQFVPCSLVDQNLSGLSFNEARLELKADGKTWRMPPEAARVQAVVFESRKRRITSAATQLTKQAVSERQGGEAVASARQLEHKAGFEGAAPLLPHRPAFVDNGTATASRRALLEGDDDQ